MSYSERKPTIIDVAERAGVSIKTVSRVINNERHVALGTRVKVREAIEALGFEANASARGMRRQGAEKSGIIAQLYGDPGGVYTANIQLGLMERCQYFGYHLVVEELDYQSPHVERRVRELIKQLRPDGAVLTAPLTDNDIILGALEEAGVPYVRVAPLKENVSVPSVRIDEQRAAYQMTQHLLAFGHTRIGYMRGLENHAATRLRYDGFSQAMKEAGVAIDQSLIENGGFRYFSALPCAQRLLIRPDRPTAIFASNDEMASAVIKVGHELGLNLPKDLSIVGFDDIPTAEMLWPALTTVRQPVEQLGSAAGDILFAHLSAGESGWPKPATHQILRYDIVLRNSTAPLKVER